MEILLISLVKSNHYHIVPLKLIKIIVGNSSSSFLVRVTARTVLNPHESHKNHLIFNLFSLINQSNNRLADERVSNISVRVFAT